MTQLSLIAAPTPRVPDLIDLRCCDCAEMLADLEDYLGQSCVPADLVIADPPWLYHQHIGTVQASEVYGCLPTSTIAEHVARARGVARRLALWVTCPLLGEWMAQTTPWGRPRTAGAWSRSGEGDSGHYGQGWHWAGSAELVLVYCEDGAHCDRAIPLRNAWVEPPQQHSRKPAAWQAQWIERWVPPGGLVVDLYAGLGSVAEAVLLAGGGRRYVGAEIDPQRHRDALGLIAQVRP